MVGATDGDDGRDAGILDAEEAGEFAFKMEHRALRGGLLAEMRERAAKEVEDVGRRVLGSGDVVEQLDEVGGEHHARVVGAEALARVDERTFAERVEFGSRAAGEADLAVEEEVKRAGESALRAQGTLRDGLELAVRGREPRDDEAGVAEANLADQDCRSGFHWDFGKNETQRALAEGGTWLLPGFAESDSGAGRFPFRRVGSACKFFQNPFEGTQMLGYPTRPKPDPSNKPKPKKATK